MTDTVDTLKQRVVGAFVIISLAVIFLPMIFDEPHQQDSNIIVNVPPRPAFQIKEIEKPVRPEFKRIEFNAEQQKVIEKQSTISADNDSISYDDNPNISQPVNTVQQVATKIAEIDNSSTTQAKASSQSKVSSQSKSSSVSHLPIFKNVWMVQLGTFSQTDNAYQLRDRLRKDGFDGHTKQVELEGGTAIRVFTGPFVDKAQAEKVKIKLDKKYKVDSRVLFFDA